MATATLFVRFKSEEFANSQSFDPDIVYPVYEIDIEEDEQGGASTVFLLANRSGDFKWIKMDDVRRASPPRQGGGNSGFFKKGQRDRRRDNQEEKSGNVKNDANPYVRRHGSILGGRDPGSLS